MYIVGVLSVYVYIHEYMNTVYTHSRICVHRARIHFGEIAHREDTCMHTFEVNIRWHDTYICICVNIFIYIYVYVFICVSGTFNPNARWMEESATNVCIYAHRSIYIYIYTYAYIYIYVFVNVCIYITLRSSH